MPYLIDAKSPSGSTAHFKLHHGSEEEAIDTIEDLLMSDHTVRVYKCVPMHVTKEMRINVRLVPHEGE